MREMIIIMVGILLCTGPVWADNDFNGLWQIDNMNAFLSVNADDTVLVALQFIPGAGEGALIGTRTGNTALINFSTQVASLEASIDLTSATTATFQVTTCNPFPDGFCFFPAGTSGSLTRLFP